MSDGTLRRNMLWGVRNGLYYALGFSAWVVIVRVVSGPVPFTQLHSSLAQTVLLYFGGGIGGGVVVGLCRPLIRNEIAAAVVGVVAAVPVCVGLKYVVEPGPWGVTGIIIVTALPVFYGAIGGPIIYRQSQRRRGLRASLNTDERKRQTKGLGP